MISMPDPVIRVNGVSRWFGSVVAVSDVFAAGDGRITGLLGPNGAGKTTLMRAITGLLSVSAGSVWVAGGDPRRARAVPHPAGEREPRAVGVAVAVLVVAVVPVVRAGLHTREPV